MKPVAHAERAHALLSASGAHRWMVCTPSARLEEKLPESTSSYADEGTAAHEYAEMRLRRRLTVLNKAERDALDNAIEEFKQSNAYYGAEMEDAITAYVEYVEERWHAAKARTRDATVLLEAKLDYSDWVPEGRGTGDVVIIADELLEVIDLKYGKGVPVSAVGNPQTRLYGLGALAEHGFLYNIRDIAMTIVQIRLDRITTETMPVEELITWAETEVRPAADKAWAGEGDHVPGEHCKFCKVKATCRARKDASMAILDYEFRDPALLTNEEIGQALHIIAQAVEWAKDVQEYAQAQAAAGHRIPGWKLVEGVSRRKLTDEVTAMARLLEAGYSEDKIIKPRELIALGQLETKVVGKKKFTELLGDLVEKPPGKPALVPETDPRPEYNETRIEFENINLED